jgi:hypothetical protein
MTRPASYRLGRTARAVLRSLVPVVCPPEAAPLTAAILDHAELTLGALPPTARRALALGLAAYDAAAVARFGRRARRLAPRDADAYFAAWERLPTPVPGLITRAAKQLLCLACYEQPAMMERVGYRPAPWIAEVSRQRLADHGLAAERQAAAVLAPDPLRPGVDVRALPGTRAGRRERT